MCCVHASLRHIVQVSSPRFRIFKIAVQERRPFSNVEAIIWGHKDAVTAERSPCHPDNIMLHQ